MPKAVNKKKKFIDPKKEHTQTFSIIHRSQKDPLAADSDAPQRVLQALPSKDEIKKRKEEEREFGVFYDDEYDYLQHMKSRDEIEYDWDEVDKFNIDAPKAATRPSSTRPGSTKPGKSSNIKLPDVVFETEGQEEEIGLLNKAAPHKGPLFDWDPDIVETLDDEFKHETVYTLKDEDMEEDDVDGMDLDDILKEAILEREYDSEVDEEGDDNNDDYESYDSDEALDDVPSLEGGFSNFSDEETKSKFTSYSMSSSVIRRNEGLSTLDDKFEKFFDDYDDENVGGCELDELQGPKSENSDIMKLMLAEHEKQRELERQPHDEALRKEVMIDEVEISSDNEKELIETEERNPYDNFDCESILTTYSTLYNHPKLISEPSIKPIRVSGKTGIPKDVLGKGLTSAALKQLDMENERFEQKTRRNDEVETMTLASRVSELSFRNKHESNEEKKARKQAVKEFRKERREEKKANRDAFKEETKMQSRNAMNLKKNHNQAIKLV